MQHHEGSRLTQTSRRPASKASQRTSTAHPELEDERWSPVSGARPQHTRCSEDGGRKRIRQSEDECGAPGAGGQTLLPRRWEVIKTHSAPVGRKRRTSLRSAVNTALFTAATAVRRCTPNLGSKSRLPETGGRRREPPRGQAVRLSTAYEQESRSVSTQRSLRTAAKAPRRGQPVQSASPLLAICGSTEIIPWALKFSAVSGCGLLVRRLGLSITIRRMVGVPATSAWPPGMIWRD